MNSGLGQATGVATKVDPLTVLREVLELEQESNPTLDIEKTITFAIANPEAEVVDSLGAVQVVCVLFGAYYPDSLIPQRLLTHKNFSTLSGLTRVISELEKK